jgi:hypothetical protein
MKEGRTPILTSVGSGAQEKEQQRERKRMHLFREADHGRYWFYLLVLGFIIPSKQVRGRAGSHRKCVVMVSSLTLSWQSL